MNRPASALEKLRSPGYGHSSAAVSPAGDRHDGVHDVPLAGVAGQFGRGCRLGRRRLAQRGRGGGQQLPGGGVAPRRILVHAGGDHQVHGVRDAPVEQRRRGRRVVQLGGELAGGVVGGERGAAGEAFEQHARQ